MKVVPALLHNTIEAFDKELQMLLPYFDHFSIDIQDGLFVPTKTIFTQQLIEYFNSHPMPTSKIFDFDLMTYSYDHSLNDIVQISSKIHIGQIFIHRSLLIGQPIPKRQGLVIGLALDPSDDISDLASIGDLLTIPAIQIMTIYPGAQGQPFMPELLTKIDQIRMAYYRLPIFIDGGVDKTTIPIILSHFYKPDFVCVGSFLSRGDEEKIVDKIEYLHSIEEK